jgi:uncharacterized RDD family membrane protein YckC
MYCTNCGQPHDDAARFCTHCGSAVQTPAPQAASFRGGAADAVPDPDSGRLLAPWWKRLLAHLLDGVVVGVPAAILTELAFFAFLVPLLPSLKNCGPGTVGPGGSLYPTCTLGNGSSLVGHFIELYAVAVALQVVIGVAYFGLTVGSRNGQTVGMMALGIAVRDASTGTSIGRRRACLRWLVVFALGLVAGIPAVIDFLSPLWDRRRQAWHDHAVKSVVLDLRASP